MKTVMAWVCASALLAACSSVTASPTPAAINGPVYPTATQSIGALQVVIVPTELVIGPNRFAVGLFDATGEIVLQAMVHFRYFDVSDPNAPVLESEADAERLTTPNGTAAIFAHERNFERAGRWGVDVQARFPDGSTAARRVAFTVVAVAATIAPGSKVPAIRTPIMTDVSGDLSLLTSANPPNPAFYQVSLDRAIGNGKPTLLLFSTPAFCTSRLCGPAYDVLAQVQKSFGDRANFIHVEVYAGLPNPAASNWQVAPAMQAFGLSSEPWVYFIDNTGIVSYRIEGLVTAQEIERHLNPLLR